MPEQPKYARFFSAVEGHVVARFGTGVGRGPATPFGVTRTKAGLVWDCESIFAISVAEAETYRTEYNRAVRDGALKERTEAEYLAWRKAQAARAAEVEAEAKAARAKAEADEAAKNTTPEASGAKPA